MIYTVWGPALARLSVIDIRSDCILDILVRPSIAIADCNTRFSGLTIEQLQSSTNADLHMAQQRLFELVNEKSILIGHSIESDLIALRIVHRRVCIHLIFISKQYYLQIVDTSVVFPHRLGPPYKRALKTLSSEILDKIIQDDGIYIQMFLLPEIILHF